MDFRQEIINQRKDFYSAFAELFAYYGTVKGRIVSSPK